MGKKQIEISPELKEFIVQQKMFFVATAAETGRINVSPKGMDTFRVINPNKIFWLNLTGSGNETAAHLLRNDRMTIMFCAFEGKPMILRLYGSAKIFHPQDKTYQEYITEFPEIRGTRQVVEMNVEMVQTSCGFGVPLMEFKEERTLLKSWGENKSDEQISEYWRTKNVLSIDDFETGIIKE